MSTGTGSGFCEVPTIEGPNGGPFDWSMRSDVKGFRDYDIFYRVRIHPRVHGPYAAWSCAGLPAPGDVWDEGETTDSLAFFTNEGDVKPDPKGKPGDNQYMIVRLCATTRPTENCNNIDHSNPLLVPDRIHLRTVNYQKEGVYDRFGEPIDNSAFEQFRGPQNEWDAHRLQVVIEQNVPDLEDGLIDLLMHNLNDAPMWGRPARTVKFSNAEVEKRYGAGCTKYYYRRLTFDLASDFDRCLLDEGTKALRGQWDTIPGSPTYGRYIVADDEDGPYGKVDPLNPRNYIRYKDWNENNTRVILNGAGLPVDISQSTPGTADDTPGRICIQYYPGEDLFQLGVPVSLPDAP